MWWGGAATLMNPKSTMKTVRLSLGFCVVLLLGCQSLHAAVANEGRASLPVPVQPAAVEAQASLASIITECERGTWEAFRKQDPVAYRALCCPEFYEISSSGTLHTLTDVLTSMKTLQTKFYTMEEVVVTPMAENVCLIRYRITVQYSEGGTDEPVSKAHASEVWVKRAGKWLAATYQETPLKP
jgi:hypothetical protein